MIKSSFKQSIKVEGEIFCFELTVPLEFKLDKEDRFYNKVYSDLGLAPIDNNKIEYITFNSSFNILEYYLKEIDIDGRSSYEKNYIFRKEEVTDLFKKNKWNIYFLT